jgi:hypothetical protein
MSSRGWKAVLVGELAILLYLLAILYFYFVHLWR